MLLTNFAKSSIAAAWLGLKQPSKGTLKKSCFENMQQTYGRNCNFLGIWSCFATLLKSHFGMGILL